MKWMAKRKCGKKSCFGSRLTKRKTVMARNDYLSKRNSFIRLMSHRFQ